MAERYASALYDLAEERRLLDEVAADLVGFKDILAESEDLRRMVRSPVIGRDEQSKAIMAILERAGAVEIVRRFIGVVAGNGRLFALHAMADAYLKLLAARRGQVGVEVTSAKELSEDQLSALGAALRASVGEKITIDRKVDPELIGGLIVKVGSRLIDFSLQTKLRRLQLAMRGAG